MIVGKRYVHEVCVPLGFIVLQAHAQRFISVPPSNRYYGQDGPWGAVTVNYGGFPNPNIADNHQWSSVDLLPGGEWTSFIISPDSCYDNSTGLCGIGGTFDPDGVSQTADNETIAQPGGINEKNGANSGLYMTGFIYAQTMNIGGTASHAGHTAYNTSTAILDRMNFTTPSDEVFPDIEVGFLALGAGSQRNEFSTYGTNSIVAWNLPGFFYNQSVIPSFSYTLNMGSAALDYPVSLTFGGYDQGRMIGPATVFGVPRADAKSSAVVTLMDIGIGVHTGASPFNFTSKNGLLVNTEGDNRAFQVSPDPVGPYLSLPRKTCDAIAAELPVSYDPSGYYLWDTDDPEYFNIVSSPAYLSFTFPSSPANGAPDDVVIKVPFILLNLTLGPELSGQTTPVPYFPCMPFTPEPDNGFYYLGRAFLQAALFGRNWEHQTAWLAQAPGPGSNREGLGIALKNIDRDDNTLDPLPGDVDEQFNSTWSAYWQRLPGETPTEPNDPISNEQTREEGGQEAEGLSSGAKAGIGAGVGAFALALVALVGLIFWRKRKSSTASQTELLPQSIVVDSRKDPSPPYSAVDPKDNAPGQDMQQFSQIARLQGFPTASDGSGMSELPARQEVHELGTSRH